MSAAQPLINQGAILAGRWQIQEFIGNGETGEVYGVRDMHSTGSFALKLFWPNALGQPEIWSALQQTARTASGLGVEGVARAYDFGIDANSARPFFVCERVSWPSLADRVRVRGPLTPAEVATALGVLSRALDAAHAVGVVHRDLKPENVFVSPENPHWVRVSDFGVALLRSASPPPPGWGGTVGWVSPDAADSNARSTPAMDIFALGLVTFFALSGGALHRSARANPIDPGALWNELTAPLDSASTRARELGASLDPAFDAWFQRAVAPMPQARFGSVSEMASAFEAIARTLVAPQSQNAVALQGVAAAIAQPLIFQPESLPPSAPLPASAAGVSSALPNTSPGFDGPTAKSPVYDERAGKRRGAAPFLIGGAVLIFALTGLGAYGLYRHRRAAAEEATAEALASASAATSAALANVPAPLAPQPAPEPVAAAPEPAAAAPSAAPEPKPEPAPVAVAAPPTPAKTAAATTAKPAAVASAKPAPVTTAKPAAAAVASAKPAATGAKPALTAAASAKPAASVKAPVKLGAPLARPKCGSTFLPCK